MHKSQSTESPRRVALGPNVLYAVSVMKNVLTLADGRLRAQARLYLQMHGRVQRRMGVTI